MANLTREQLIALAEKIKQNPELMKQFQTPTTYESVLQRAGVSGQVPKTTFEKGVSAAIEETSPEAQRKSLQFEQEQTERGRSRQGILPRPGLPGLQQVPIEQFREIPTEITETGAVKKKIEPTPESLLLRKKEEEKIKGLVGAEKRLTGTKNFIRNFSESRNELINSGFSDIGAANFQGLMSRVGATLQEKTGTLPKTTKFLNRLNVIANQSARDVEGGRVTDLDRQVYADAMANAIKFPDITNIGLVADSLIDLKNLGGNIEPVLNELRDSNQDLFINIANEVDNALKPLGQTAEDVDETILQRLNLDPNQYEIVR